MPEKVPQDLTLCIFRIVQERLRNVVKHSGVSEAIVEYSGHGDFLDVASQMQVPVWTSSL